MNSNTHLLEAGAIAGFDPAGEIPDELRIDKFAALLAGQSNGDRYKTFLRMVRAAIGAKTLKCRWETRKVTARMAVQGQPPASIPVTIALVSRASAVAWLKATNEAPNELVQAWLGPAWGGQEKISTSKTPPVEKRKRSALILECRDRWPTIERDLQDAARNGLSDAAKLPDGRGWDKNKALEWARERGKLVDQESNIWSIYQSKKATRGR